MSSNSRSGESERSRDDSLGRKSVSPTRGSKLDSSDEDNHSSSRKHSSRKKKRKHRHHSSRSPDSHKQQHGRKKRKHKSRKKHKHRCHREGREEQNKEQTATQNDKEASLKQDQESNSEGPRVTTEHGTASDSLAAAHERESKPSIPTQDRAMSTGDGGMDSEFLAATKSGHSGETITEWAEAMETDETELNPKDVPNEMLVNEDLFVHQQEDQMTVGVASLVTEH